MAPNIRKRKGDSANTNANKAQRVERLEADSAADVIGIDLGTTNSAVAVFQNGAPHVLKNFEGEPLTPSCVSFSNDTKEVFVGDLAVSKKSSDYEHTIYDVKRLLGMSFESVDVQRFRDGAPFKVRNVDNRIMLEIYHNNETILMSPIDISAKVLKNLRETAERRLNTNSSIEPVPITKAVITVPAYFSQVQKRDTLNAAKLAGLAESELITEPAAAAYAYVFEQHKRSDVYKLLVYDFGGGTFDVTILEVDQGHLKQLAIDGNVQLGGRDIDQELRKHIANKIKAKHGKDLLANKRLAQKLLQQCEKKKIALTTNDKFVRLDLSSFSDIDDELVISREEFNTLCRPLIMRSIDIVKSALQNSNCTTEQIAEVLLVGGTSLVPLVKELLSSELGFPIQKLNRSIAADEAIALGAAIKGAQISGKCKLQMSMSLVEAIPLSLGMKVRGDIYSPIILRNSQIPAKAAHNFVTANNNQTSMPLQFYEGERKIASKNNYLGELIFTGLKKGIAGSAAVTVTLELDRNGILNVSAEYEEKTMFMQIKNEARKNTEREVEGALNDAELNLIEDTIFKEREKAKSRFYNAIERTKYDCDSQLILAICQIFMDWLNNASTTTSVLIAEKEKEFKEEIKKCNALATYEELMENYMEEDKEGEEREDLYESFDETESDKSAESDQLNEIGRSSSLVHQIQPGVCGLQNLGNTSAMNSALQCLSNVPALTEYFCKKKYLEDINSDNPQDMGGKLAMVYAETIESMWSGNHASIRPAKLKKAIDEFAAHFNDSDQKDSQELTALLLGGLHKDLNRIKTKPCIEEKEANGRSDEIVSIEAWTDYKRQNDSIIVDLMHGQLKSTITCSECDKMTVKFEPFSFLPVSVSDPAKGRKAKSVITLVRSKRWAKFAISHTSKTTVAQVTTAIKENLGLPQEHRLALVPAFSGEILADGSFLAPNPEYDSYRNYFAFIVKEGPMIIIENKTAGFETERNLGTCPIVLNYPEEMECSFIMKEVIEALQAYLFKEEECQSIPSLEIVPDEVTLIHNNKLYPIKANKPFPVIEKPHGTLRMMLYWNQKIASIFKYVNLDSLVDREICLTSVANLTLAECIDLFTTQEQLDVNDEWFCSNCEEHRCASKKLDLWRLPKILIIHLKRFLHTNKDLSKIEIPTKDFNLAGRVLQLNEKSNASYDLIGIIDYAGRKRGPRGITLGGMHFIAQARNDQNQKWCKFNDEDATICSDLPDKISSRKAYLLFYQRRE